MVLTLYWYGVHIIFIWCICYIYMVHILYLYGAYIICIWCLHYTDMVHILYVYGAYIIFILCIHYIFWCPHNVLIRTLYLFDANIIWYGGIFHYLRSTFYLFLHEFYLFCTNIICIWCTHYITQSTNISFICYHIIFIWCEHTIHFVCLLFYFNCVCFGHTWYLFGEQFILFSARIELIWCTHYIIWCVHYIIWYTHYNGFLPTRKLLNQWFLVVKSKSSHHVEGSTFDTIPIRDMYVTNVHQYVPLVVSASESFPHSWLANGLVTRVTWRLRHVEQEQLTFPEHMSSSRFWVGFVWLDL